MKDNTKLVGPLPPGAIPKYPTPWRVFEGGRGDNIIFDAKDWGVARMYDPYLAHLVVDLVNGTYSD